MVWTQGHSGTTGGLTAVAYGNGRFAALAGRYDGETENCYHKLMTSSDGTTWTSHDLGTRSRLVGITYCNSQFLPFGDYSVILSSTDLAAWTARHAMTSGTIYAMAYGNGQFVALAGTGTNLTSTDGLSWISRCSGTSGALFDIAYGDGRFVATGEIQGYQQNQGTIATSADGIVWTVRTFENPDWFPRIVYGNGLFVISAGSSKLFTSTDGSTWTPVTLGLRPGSFGNFGALACGNSQFLAGFQSGTILGSPNAITWTTKSADIRWGINALAYGNGHFVGVGNSGAILQSGEIITLKPAARSPDGALQLAVTGQAGHDYLIQSSTDLADWHTLTSLTMTNESVQFTDRSANGCDRHFYRAVWP